MKTITKLTFALFALAMLFTACSKDKENNKTVTLPELNVLTAEDVSQDAVSATVNVGIISDGGGSITGKGVFWSTDPNPGIGNNTTNDGAGTASFVGNLTKLEPNTLYYIRAYATNSAGIAYSNEITVTTTTTIKDIDGNSYGVVRIGTQIWMASNLKTAKYNDGTAIPKSTNTASYGIGSYSIYNDLLINNAIYGKLYNFYAVETGKLCPKDWHIPSDAEWIILSDYLGGASVAGGKMKSTSTIFWNSPNIGATNESGFSGLPGGNYDTYYSFTKLGNHGYFWSSTRYTDESSDYAWYRSLKYDDNTLNRNNFTSASRYSCRCVRD